MATPTIDTKSLTDIITEFRKITAKDAITPESLGYILQRIADLLATAGTQETSTILMAWYNAIKSAASECITAISQGSTDRNDVKLTPSTVALLTGTKKTLADSIVIRQATTERAGAMRAQQVTDLNNARRGVTALEKSTAQLTASMADLFKRLGVGDGTSVPKIFITAQIGVRVRGGSLELYGHKPLVAAGYVPYIFRWTRKRNQFKDKYATADNVGRRYCTESKGWHLYGSMYAVRVSGELVQFTTNSHNNLHLPSQGWSTAPSAVVKVRTNKKGFKAFGWGRSVVVLRDYKSKNKNNRMIRLRFAIGFAPKIKPGKVAVTPANLVSSLAEFSIVYDPKTDSWVFSK